MSATCKVCGVTLKKLTATHMKVHNMTLDEYYKAYPANSSPPVQTAMIPSQLIKGLSDWVNTGKLPENVETLVNNLYSDPESKLRTILMAIALSKVDRLATLQGVIDRVSGLLYDQKKLEKCSTFELMSLLRMSHGEVTEILGLFKDIAIQPKTSGDTFNFTNIVAANVPMPDKADSRAKLYHFLEAVLQKANTIDVQALEPKNGTTGSGPADNGQDKKNP